MIEKMIDRVKQCLPLTILEISWDGANFHMYGESWSFSSLSAWRICTPTKMILGCYDSNSENSISYLKNIDILKIEFQENLLKIDPVFMLSNNQILEIFSTDTYEPWVFQAGNSGVYVATPGEPAAFTKDDS